MAQNAYKTANFWGNAKWKLCSIKVEGSYYQLAGVHLLSRYLGRDSEQYQNILQLSCFWASFVVKYVCVEVDASSVLFIYVYIYLFITFSGNSKGCLYVNVV